MERAYGEVEQDWPLDSEARSPTRGLPIDKFPSSSQLRGISLVNLE